MNFKKPRKQPGYSSQSPGVKLSSEGMKETRPRHVLVLPIKLSSEWMFRLRVRLALSNQVIFPTSVGATSLIYFIKLKI